MEPASGKRPLPGGSSPEWPLPSIDPMSAAQALRYRAASERFLSRRDWLESWHTFSFGGHDDPAWRGFGPLRVINDDRITAGHGFGLHPHRDVDIITVMVEGQLDHKDSLGHRGRLLAGDVQVMEAGTGIEHSEINGGQGDCRLLQIWIDPAAADAAPRYAQRTIQLQHPWTPLVAPAPSGSALSISRPIHLWRGRGRASELLSVPVQEPGRGWLQVISGRVQLEGRTGAGPDLLHAGDGVGFVAGAIPALRMLDDDGDLLLFELN